MVSLLSQPRILVLGWGRGWGWDGEALNLVKGIARRPVPPSELVPQAVFRVTFYQYSIKHMDLKFTIKQGWP